MCSGSWSNASDAPTLSRNTPCMVTMSNYILNAHKSHHKTDVSIDVAEQHPFWLLHKGHSFNALSLINVYHLLHCLDCIQQETVLELCWHHHISFPSVPTQVSKTRNGDKSGQYRECRIAMPFYRVLIMLYEIPIRELFRPSPMYILKHNAFQGQVWPHFKGSFLQNNCHHMTIIYTVTNAD